MDPSFTQKKKVRDRKLLLKLQQIKTTLVGSKFPPIKRKYPCSHEKYLIHDTSVVSDEKVFTLDQCAVNLQFR